MSAVNLEKLLEAGAYVRAGYEEKPVTWQNEDGQELTFTVRVKQEMTGADHEFIILGVGDRRGTKGKEDASMMARRVHRMVKVFNPDTSEYEAIPVAVAERMKTSLLRAILQVVNEVEHEPETAEESEKN